MQKTLLFAIFIVTQLSSLFSQTPYWAYSDYWELSRTATMQNGDYVGADFTAFIDINNDGKRDMVTKYGKGSSSNGTPYVSPTLNIYLNTGTGFSLSSTMNVPDFAQRSRQVHEDRSYFMDLNNDGRKDFLMVYSNWYSCGNNRVFVYFNNGSAPFFTTSNSTELSMSNGASCAQPYLLDLDNDGDKDVFIDNMQCRPDYVFKNNGGGGFSLTSQQQFTNRDYNFEVVNYNGGGEDLIGTKHGWADNYYGLYYYRSNNNSGLQTPLTYYTSNPSDPGSTCTIGSSANPGVKPSFHSRFVVTGDPNMDIVFTAENDGTNRSKLYIGKWNGSTFNFNTNYTIDANNYFLELFDLNNDGNKDLLYTIPNGDLTTLKVAYNNGSGGFGSIETIFCNSPKYFATVGNLTNANSPQVAALTNDSMYIWNISKVTASAGNDVAICAGNSTILTATGGVSYAWNNGLGNGAAKTVTPTATTTYTVTITSNAGCTSTDSVTVTVNPTQTPNFTQVPGICTGGSFSLPTTSNNGISGSWSPAINNMATTTYTFTPNAALHPCTSSATMTVTVNPNPTVSISGQLNICATSNIELTATGSGSSNYSYSWSEPGGWTTSGATAIRNNATTAMSGTYTVTVTDGNGCRATDNVTVTVNALPPSTVTPQGSLTFCQGGSVTLSGPGGSGLSYQWKRNGTNVGTGQTYSANQSGAYTLEVTQNATGCKSVAPAINVTVHPSPVVSIQTNRPQYCEGDNATLTASGGIQYVWILPTGTQLPPGSQPLVIPQLALPHNQGLYTVVGQDANGCRDTASVNLTLYPAPSLAITGRDTLCFEENTVLNAVSSGISYQWNTGATSPTLHVYPSAPGAYTYVVTVTDANGCRATRSTTIRVHPRPAVTIGGDQVICNGTAAMLQAGGVGANTFLWSTGAQTAAISVSPNVSTTYHLTGTNQFGCRDTATAVVSVRYPPVSVAGNDQTVCRDTAVFEAALPDGGAGEWIALNTAFIAQPQLATATVFDLESGQNIFRWRVVTPPCPGEALDSVVIFLADQVPSAMPDDTVSLVGQRVEMLLAANDTLNHLTGFVFFLTDADQSGSWSLDSDGKLAFVPNSGFTGIAKATYKVCNALCTDYCDTSSITIIVRKPEDEVGQTQLVTPNGDGHNEDLVFDYLDQYPDNSIVIFNRWGDVVFRAKPYLNNWVRNHSGGKLPAGTYYYILNVQGSLGLIWGNVLLMR